MGQKIFGLVMPVRMVMGQAKGENIESVARARFVEAAMLAYIQRHPFAVVFPGLLAIAPACGQASPTTISINATIVEVQCTAEQRTRIRACAPAQENYTTEPSKMMVRVQAANGSAPMLGARYEIQLDPKRPVLIKTVLY